MTCTSSASQVPNIEVAKLMQSKPNLYIICWTLLESQQIQRKHHIIWYYCTILYNLFNIYIYIIYMIDSFQSSHSIDVNFLRSRISSETFQVCDPQDFPLRPLVGIDHPFLLVSWLPIRWIFPMEHFLLELVRGESWKMATNWWKTWYVWYRCDFVLLWCVYVYYAQ